MPFAWLSTSSSETESEQMLTIEIECDDRCTEWLQSLLFCRYILARREITHDRLARVYRSSWIRTINTHRNNTVVYNTL